MKSYMKYLGIHLKSSLEYKTSFILSIISQIIVFLSYYFSVIALFERFSNIKGYTLYEVLLTFAVIQFGFSFCETFFRGIDTKCYLCDEKRKNEFRTLTRPFQLFHSRWYVQGSRPS